MFYVKHSAREGQVSPGVGYGSPAVGGEVGAWAQAGPGVTAVAAASWRLIFLTSPPESPGGSTLSESPYSSESTESWESSESVGGGSEVLGVPLLPL